MSEQSLFDGGRREAGQGLGDRVPLAQAVAGVRGQALIAVAAARGPRDLDAIDLRGRSQSEVKAGVARRQIAASAEPRGDLGSSRRRSRPPARRRRRDSRRSPRARA